MGLLVVVKVNRAIEHRLHLGLHRGVIVYIPALAPRLKLQECRIALFLKTAPHAMKTRVADLRFYGLIDRHDTSLTGQCPILCFSPHMCQLSVKLLQSRPCKVFSNLLIRQMNQELNGVNGTLKNMVVNPLA